MEQAEKYKPVSIRKVVQIQVGRSGELIALCDDGTLWENCIDDVQFDAKYPHEWKPLRLPPQIIPNENR